MKLSEKTCSERAFLLGILFECLLMPLFASFPAGPCMSSCIGAFILLTHWPVLLLVQSPFPSEMKLLALILVPFLMMLLWAFVFYWGLLLVSWLAALKSNGPGSKDRSDAGKRAI